MPLAEMVALHDRCVAPGRRRRSGLKHNYISTLTQLSRELFVSTEGALIDQSFALTQGMALVVGVGGRGQPGAVRRDRPPARLGDPHRRRRRAAAPAARPSSTSPWPWRARAWSWRPRPPCRPREREEVVVTDPHYNTLVSHEIVGHPVELDRALKMETAYAGRSWLLTALDRASGGPADRLAAGERVLRSVAARLRALSLRPRGHAGRAGHAHRSRGASAAS